MTHRSHPVRAADLSAVVLAESHFAKLQRDEDSAPCERVVVGLATGLVRLERRFDVRTGSAGLRAPQLESLVEKNEAKLPATAVTTKIDHASSATSTIRPPVVNGFLICD